MIMSTILKGGQARGLFSHTGDKRRAGTVSYRRIVEKVYSEKRERME